MSGRRSFNIRFGRSNIRTVTVEPDADADEVRARLRLPIYDCAILMHVGAGSSTAEIIKKLEPTFREQLAPLAEKYNIAVIDGATNSGFVGMMGAARAAIGGKFPLIGIMPLHYAKLPNLSGEALDSHERHEIEQNHTDLILVKGDHYGVESDLMVRFGKLIGKRVVAVLINGGEIVRKEARLNAIAKNPLLVLQGSGRVADELAEAFKRGTDDDALKETIEIGIIRITTIETFISDLKDLLGLERPS